MGESTFVNQVNARPRTMSQAGHGMDWILVSVVAGLLLFGLLMVYSAGPKFALANNSPADYFVKRQLMWAAVGVVATIILSRINYHLYQRLAVLMIIATIFALIASAALGNTTLGANRSLLNGSIRPSELAKVVTIIYVAVWLTAKRDVLNDITVGLMPLIVILGLNAGLIMIQPDFSAAITVVILGGILFFMAGGAWRQIALTILITVLFGWVVVNVYPTGMRRITEYIAGLHNPLDASYHVQRSLEAVINGKLFGVGIGHSSTKFTGLPVAPTDSIFAVIAEETGLIGAGMVILAYMILLWRGLRIAQQAPDFLGMLLASGMSIWIAIEALLNMAVMVNLMPQAGNALPFISYGGSSLVATLTGIGVLLNVARCSDTSKSTKGGGTFGAVVDLRWRDRRRRVSRYGHSSGPER